MDRITSTSLFGCHLILTMPFPQHMSHLRYDRSITAKSGLIAVHGPHKTLYNRFVRWSRMGTTLFAAGEPVQRVLRVRQT